MGKSRFVYAFICRGAFGLFPVLPTANKITMDTHIQVFVWTETLNSFEQTSGSPMSGS